MAQYSSMAALRRALTGDNPDERGDAYGAVYEADLRPSAVLSSDVEDEVVQRLVDRDVIPDAGRDRMETTEYRARVLELLEEIAGNSGGA